MMGGYIAAWGINTNWQNQRFDNLQSGQDKIWNQLSTDRNRVECLAHNIDKCCSQAVDCV
jgi:hypothetical protein